MTEIDLLAKDRLYYHADGWVEAIRLYGASSERIPASRLIVRYEHTGLTLTPELEELRTRVLQERTAEAERQAQLFFDGPNTRLIEWRATPRSDSRVGLEEAWLELRLGPVSWFEFEGLNGAFREQQVPGNLPATYEYYVGLSHMLKDGSPSRSRLSNILDNAITLVSNDGYAGYQQRSSRVSLAEGRFTSSVAENTNRYLDDADPSNPERLFNPPGDHLSSGGRAPTDYEPQGVPHPLSATRRGISDEISPRLLDRLNSRDIFVVGLAFDLEGLHPSLLVCVLLDLTRDEILEARRVEPGKEHHEGTLDFVPTDLMHPATRVVLQKKEWVPAGQASLVRTLEMLRSVGRELGLNPMEAAARLRAQP